MLNKEGVYISVISHMRWENVSRMSSLIGNATWYVGCGQGNLYRAYGAEFVVESGGLCRSRNAALGAAFAQGAPCLQLSDDLNRMKLVVQNGARNVASAISFSQALQHLQEALEETGAYYAGALPTDSLLYATPNKPISTNRFIVGDFILVKPSPLRFDETLRLKEDYDYTLQHLFQYGKVARCNNLLFSFAHGTNAGGAVSYRTSDLELQTISRLMDKWPGSFRMNPKRKNEVLLQWPPRGNKDA